MSMVLAILGVAGVGKSTIARHCALRWPAKRYVDVATVREVLRSFQPELDCSTYEAWRLVGDDPSPAALAAGFERYCDLMWPGVQSILASAAREGATMVLEGAMMSPRLLQQVAGEGLPVLPRMLWVPDAAVHLARLRGSVDDNSPMQRRLVQSFPQVRALQTYLREQCLERGIPVIENEDLEGTLARVIPPAPVAAGSRRGARGV